jgi:hypothetical protein
LKAITMCGTYRTMIEKPDSFENLLSHWSTLELSADLGVVYVTARTMRERSSVDAAHWDKLLSAAKRKGIPVAYADLVALRRQKATA